MNLNQNTIAISRISKANYLLLSLFSLFLFSSCEKVIELDLQNTKPIIVIEGSVSNRFENQFVRISKTIDFTKTNTFGGLKGAKVSLSSSSGLKVDFFEVEDGLYKSPEFKGIPGNTYKLEVLAEGKVYSANSTMPLVVTPDSLRFKKLSFFGSTNIFPAVYYKDPQGIQNQYRYLLKINSKELQDFVSEDRFNDGNEVSDLIFNEGEDIKSGDTIHVEMQSIDRNVFKYYFALKQIKGEGGPPVAPANPNSNFNNGALGIFSAHTKAYITGIVK
jgi:hypothetical protein